VHGAIQTLTKCSVSFKSCCVSVVCYEVAKTIVRLLDSPQPHRLMLTATVPTSDPAMSVTSELQRVSSMHENFSSIRQILSLASVACTHFPAEAKRCVYKSCRVGGYGLQYCQSMVLAFHISRIVVALSIAAIPALFECCRFRKFSQCMQTSCALFPRQCCGHCGHAVAIL
jgi:hypothetical protein